MNMNSIKEQTHNFRSVFDTVEEDLENAYIYRADGLYKVDSFNTEGEKPLYIVDLRAANELEDKGYLPTESNTIYKNMSFYGKASSLGNSPEIISNFKHMGEMYTYMIDNYQSAIKDILQFIINIRDGEVLLHCTSGKDRTGIISMLLLEMLEVPKDAIINSYALSEINTVKLAEEQKKGLGALAKEVPSFLFDSKAENMVHLYDYIQSKYGSVIGYIRHIGINDADINSYVKYVKGR